MISLRDNIASIIWENDGAPPAWIANAHNAAAVVSALTGDKP